MPLRTLLAFLTLQLTLFTWPAPSILSPDSTGKYTIHAPGIRALFVPYGASLTNLFVPDKHGIERDIVLGYDNATAYTLDKSHPHLGGVPGRYANRIRNSTFDIDGVVYHVAPNENGGRDTLHGGPDGWDYRNFTVTAHTQDSITFSLVDPDGKEGFPGEVASHVTYSVTPNTWHISMKATPTTPRKKTPIMLSSHVYWNLDGFQNPKTALALNHTLHLPYAGLRIDVDPTLIPTGALLPNTPGSVNDFWALPKALGQDLTKAGGNCGADCTGYDNCYIHNLLLPTPWDSHPVAKLSSPWSGITLSISTDQSAFQVYTCNGQNSTLPLKETQGFFGDSGRERVVERWGCVVLEVQDYIDGVNHPEWGREGRQVFGAGEGYELEAVYRFSARP